MWSGGGILIINRPKCVHVSKILKRASRTVTEVVMVLGIDSYVMVLHDFEISRLIGPTVT